MRHIGGEVELKYSNHSKAFLAYSGRAGIRMFCRNFPDKKILLPDFLCYIIVDLLEEEQMQYDFYHVDENLKIDTNSVKSKDFDALFIINYYGKRHDYLADELDLGRLILIQDTVFDLNVKNYLNAPKWYGFNSLRKMTELADGCIIRTNLPVKNLIENCEGAFVESKYLAKELKYRYLHEKIGSESDYLELFEKAESMLDEQKPLCRISAKSLELLCTLFENYDEEKARRRENFNILKEMLGNLWIEIETEFPSFFVIKTKKRDELRRYLFAQKIFLPVHWPYFGVENELFHQVLSIPVFSKYSKDDMRYVAEHIREFLEHTA